MAKYFEKIRAHRTTLVIDTLDGEDDDFVQLRIQREKRQKEHSTCTPNEQKKKRTRGNTLERLVETSKKLKPVVGKDDQQKLQKKLFKCIEDKSLDKFISTIDKQTKGVDPETIRDPKTNMNILHYALEMDSMDIANYLIDGGKLGLFSSTYSIQRSSYEGFKNILHILTEKDNAELIGTVLSKLDDAGLERELMNMETIVDIDGQRPKLLPCLHLAAYLGSTNMVDFFLRRAEIGIDSLNSKKETALMWASRRGHVDIVLMLIKKGANANIENGKGSTALYWASRYNHIEVAKVLITEGKADLKHTRKYGLVSPFVLTCAYGHEELVDLFLNQKSIDINVSIRGGEMAIHHAVKEGHIRIVKKLMEKGAAYDTPDEFGDTPLLLAVRNGQVEMASLLINKGADVERRNREGHDIWEYAIDMDTEEMLETLVIETQNMDITRLPLCIAAEVGSIGKIEFLLQMGVDPRMTDKDGNTFIHYAAMQDNYEVVKRFCSPDLVDLQNKIGNTALHIACYRGFESAIYALIDVKASIGIKNEKGETALHSAAYCKTMTAKSANKLVEYTLKNFSWDTLNSKDFQGNNCLHIAAKNANPDVIWQFRNVSIRDQDKDGMTPLHESVRPNEPEALEIALDIFEQAKRDARLNEQTFVSRETVLNFAARACHVEGVERLILLGADISERDCNGDTVLHKILFSCTEDASNKLQHLAIFDVILNNIVKWWCIKNKLSEPHGSDSERKAQLKTEAVNYIAHTQLNKSGMSVTDLAFALGCSDIVYRLLMMQDVAYHIKQDVGSCNHEFDVTDLIPRTKRAIKTTKADKKIFKEGRKVNESQRIGEKINKLSGIEWLITSKDCIQTGKILDIPPITTIEKHYMSLVGIVFTTLLILHVIYMGLLTYIGVEMQQRLRKDNFSTIFENITKSDSAVLYFLVPLEPVIIILLMLFSGLKYCYIGDIRRRKQMSKNLKLSKSISVLQEYALPFAHFCFAITVIAWIILLREENPYQDYLLALALCVGWLISISFTRGIKMVHYFSKMIFNIISRDVLRFLLVYIFVLLAISFGLHVLFQISDEVVRQYQTPGATVFMTLNLMTGMATLFDDTLESGMHSVGRTTLYIKAFYLLYFVLSTIILLNVLIAMMNDSYSNVLREKTTDWRIESIKLGMELERVMPLCRIFSPITFKHGYLGHQKQKRWYVTLSDEDMDHFFEEIERKSYKPDALTNRLETIEQRIVAIERVLNQKLQQISDTLETKKKKGVWRKGLHFKSRKDGSSHKKESFDDRETR